MASPTITPSEYQAFRILLEEACGILLGEDKHYLVSSRLGRLMQEEGLATLGELVTRLSGIRGASLRTRVIDAMTTNETLWFRDTTPYDALTLHILPQFAQTPLGRPLRIWSAACSSGQEPYSISIAVQEYLLGKPGQLTWGVQIVGTDISSAILKEANAGIYDSTSLARGLSPERRQRFFTPVDGKWQVKPELRTRVSFKELNLKQSYAALAKFDIIFCRNVLIYFSADLKRDILTRMAQALNPDGYLILGSSEAISNLSSAFEMVHYASGVVYRLKNSTAGR
ncbi:MAG: protein-glutamate O-methyltransferase CheR [Gammaproteobacteria bacterium]|nr:protein-glutamate O-methyltransferase CheR [Gammaproteobacteria bacterium]